MVGLVTVQQQRMAASNEAMHTGWPQTASNVAAMPRPPRSEMRELLAEMIVIAKALRGPINEAEAKTLIDRENAVIARAAEWGVAE